MDADTRRRKGFAFERALIQAALAEAARRYPSPEVKVLVVGGVRCALLADGTVRRGSELLSASCRGYKRLAELLKVRGS